METWAPGRIVFNRKKNRDKTIDHCNHSSCNYWTPLTDQVEESEQINIAHEANAEQVGKPTTKLSKARRKWQKRMKKRLDRRLSTVDILRRLIECGSIATEDWEEANHHERKKPFM